MSRDFHTATAIVVSLSVLVSLVTAKGAGRVFPIEAENFAIDNFQRVNPSIAWDHTNFLIDLSGQYANCKALQGQMGPLKIDRKAPDGSTIFGLIGSIEGGLSDSTAVTGYIEELIKRWMSQQMHHKQIKDSNRVGCSVRPGCSGYAVVVCLFAAPSGPEEQKDRPVTPAPKIPSTTRFVQTRPPPTAAPQPVHTEIPYVQRALAFTPEQYDVSEGVLGKNWDRSHYMENLSGYETDCMMINNNNWDFHHMGVFNLKHGLKIQGQYGYAVNRGSTQEAMLQILKTFKPVTKAKDLGCSLIADCFDDKRVMYVVVSCLYEE